MYQVSIKKPLTAFHHLVGGDWGRENQHHSHDYVVEVVLEGPGLDGHGYLFDLALLRGALDGAHARYQGADLNELPEFAGLNPSVEHFARLFALHLCRGLRLPGVTSLTLKLWEDPDSWASWRTPFPPPGP